MLLSAEKARATLPPLAVAPLAHSFRLDHRAREALAARRSWVERSAGGKWPFSRPSAATMASITSAIEGGNRRKLKLQQRLV
eukprot:488729-Pyramimonas_sp.AAC.1